MNNKNIIYAAYGSNLNLEQMNVRCPYATVVGTAEIPDYQLLFRGDRRSAVATIEPQEGGSVPVLLWELTPRDEEALDRYEGFPWLYRKEDITVKYKGKFAEVMVYIMNDGYAVGTPSDAYYNTILKGYEQAGFDKQILEKAVMDSNTAKHYNPFQ